MRKYIFAIILIVCGLILLFSNYKQEHGPSYSETVFAQSAQDFDQFFERFSTRVKENIRGINSEYSDTLKIRDTTATRAYFFELLKNNKALNSVVYFQGKRKIAVIKENSSFLYAHDTTKKIDIVKWQRFEDDQLISSWFESFDNSIQNWPSYQELINDPGKVKWYLNHRIDLDQPEQKEAKFYAGFSYATMTLQNVIILEFSKKELLKTFKVQSKHISPRLSFLSLDGRELFIESDLEADSLGISNTAKQIDSLQLNIIKHFSNFENLDQGSFNFKFNNQVYWNSFKKLSPDSGIQFYILTIPNSQIINDINTGFGTYLFWLGLALILIGGSLLLIRKRYFYRPNRMEIPSVKDILEEDENRYLEFKSSLRWDYRQEKVNPELEKVIMKTIAAFGNTDGGILLIGIDDDKNILGLEKDLQTLKKSDIDYYEVHLRNLMHKLMGVKYVSNYIRTEFEPISGQFICKIKVIPAKEPLFLKYKNKNGHEEEKFYVRSGNSSHEINSIAEINDYINTKFKK